MSKRQLFSALLALGLVGEIAAQQVHSFAPEKMDNVLYGVAYYPEYMPYDRLDKDVDLMQKAGITVVRVGESTWSSWEPRDGDFQFAWMQRVLDRLHQAGIKVILGTPTYSIPTWLYKEHPEILAEYATVHHRDLATSQTFNTTSYYVQVAYRLPWEASKWKPYYRFEYIHRPRAEPVWDFSTTPSVVDLVGSLVGVRYDITNFAAFKGEYRRARRAVNEPNVNGAFFQTAFTF
jgi:hypothetical protein